MKKILLLGLIVLMGCTGNSDAPENSHTYIVRPIKIIETDSLGKEHETGEILRTGSTNNNFIIDEQGRFFYYGKRRNYAWNCMPEDNPKEEFIYLDPSQLIELTENQIEMFVNLNINKTDTLNRNRMISIASVRDTFKSPALTKLIDKLDRKNPITHILRHLTEEEKVVLKYRKSGEDYFYWDIDWDTTRVRLDFKPEPIH